MQGLWTTLESRGQTTSEQQRYANRTKRESKTLDVPWCPYVVLLFWVFFTEVFYFCCFSWKCRCHAWKSIGLAIAPEKYFLLSTLRAATLFRFPTSKFVVGVTCSSPYPRWFSAGQFEWQKNTTWLSCVSCLAFLRLSKLWTSPGLSQNWVLKLGLRFLASPLAISKQVHEQSLPSSDLASLDQVGHWKPDAPVICVRRFR